MTGGSLQAGLGAAMLADGVLVLLRFSLMLRQICVEERLELVAQWIEGTAQCDDRGDCGPHNAWPLRMLADCGAVGFKRPHVACYRLGYQRIEVRTEGVIHYAKSMQQRKDDSPIVDRALGFGVQFASAREGIPLEAIA